MPVIVPRIVLVRVPGKFPASVPGYPARGGATELAARASSLPQTQTAMGWRAESEQMPKLRPLEGSSMILKAKVAALVAAPALALIATAVLSTAPAQASVATPAAYGPTICSGDVCIQSHCGDCASQNIAEWLSTTTYVGHFETQWGCSEDGGCVTGNSPNHRWYAGGTAYIYRGMPYGVAACVYFWAGPYSSGERWRGKGRDCFSTDGLAAGRP